MVIDSRPRFTGTPLVSGPAQHCRLVPPKAVAGTVSHTSLGFDDLGRLRLSIGTCWMSFPSLYWGSGETFTCDP